MGAGIVARNPGPDDPILFEALKWVVYPFFV
jgi:hypothetical protein